MPYLARLGVTHLYLSPITRATAGSAHGYDVTDPTTVGDALGGEAALRDLATIVHAADMAILLDIVPNHMAASTENAWWADLLENGRASTHAATFDTPLQDAGTDRLCLPVLGASLDATIERGELTIGERDGRPVLQYHDRWFPLPQAVAPLIDDVRRGSAPLEALLEALEYRLCDWQTVRESLCYRRFFDITDLVGIRVEDARVFARTHAGILDWIRRGWIDGLRIDHVDGLRDPAAYLATLARATADARNGRDRCYTVVEKILAADEILPADWACDGATGYEFTRIANAFLVDPEGYARLDAGRRGTTGETRQFSEFVRDCKLYALDTLFPAELTDVAQRWAALTFDPPAAVQEALRHLTAALDVYRTYISDASVATTDRRRISEARMRALPNLASDQVDVLARICQVLQLGRTDASDEERARTLDVIARWQQLSGPVMAKGFEDTALYAWPALLALNEVGGEPERTLDADDVHAFFAQRAGSTAGALNATSTHDTKRSEDVRARLLVLSERPDEWEDAVARWLPMLRSAHARIAPRDEFVLLQTLIGAWPLDRAVDDDFIARIQRFMLKAAREAKQETGWLTPNTGYEQALERTVDHALRSPVLDPFRREVQALVDRIALHGAANSLAQMLLKCTAPGVPDVYQGTEVWRFDLVDPDNRRPVDFARLEGVSRALTEMVAHPASEHVRVLLHAWRDGRIKQYVLMAALACRARQPALGSGYEALPVVGRHASSVLAFRRSAPGSQVISIVTRWPARLVQPDQLPVGSLWGDTAIEIGARDRAWTCALTGARLAPVNGRIRLAEALAVLPLALLEGA